MFEATVKSGAVRKLTCFLTGASTSQRFSSCRKKTLAPVAESIPVFELKVCKLPMKPTGAPLNLDLCNRRG